MSRERQSLIIQKANTRTVEKPKPFWGPSILLYAFSLTLNEGGGNWGGTVFKLVSSATWSAVLVNRFDGQENRNHLLNMSFRDILRISIMQAASVLSFITEKLEPS